MIEIKWAKERSFGSTIFTGNYCDDDCDLYNAWDESCCAGYGVEDDEDVALMPGPKCPGPGRYILTKLEV